MAARDHVLITWAWSSSHLPQRLCSSVPLVSAGQGPLLWPGERGPSSSEASFLQDFPKCRPVLKRLGEARGGVAFPERLAAAPPHSPLPFPSRAMRWTVEGQPPGAVGRTLPVTRAAAGPVAAVPLALSWLLWSRYFPRQLLTPDL